MLKNLEIFTLILEYGDYDPWNRNLQEIRW